MIFVSILYFLNHTDVDTWVAVIYDNDWFPGIVEEVADDGKIKIKFMKPISGNKFAWPTKPDVDVIPSEDILAKLQDPPIPMTRHRRHFALTEAEHAHIDSLHQIWIAENVY